MEANGFMGLVKDGDVPEIGNRMGGPDNRRIYLANEGGLEMVERNRLKAVEVPISEIYIDDDSLEQFVEAWICGRCK